VTSEAAPDPLPRTEAEIRAEIAALVDELCKLRSGGPARRFVPGQSPVPYAGRVYDEREVKLAVEASLDFWLTLGPYGKRFERELARIVGVRHATLCNSGSSANLLALSALTSPKLERPLRPGDEVLTVAAGFPTTVNPIIQNGCVPVFVDVEPGTYGPDPQKLADAVSERTRAVMIAHTLGNPFDLDAVTDLCRRRGLYLVEDNCDSLGSLYAGRFTGSFGDLATQSFYPPHHISMGEGGAVLTSNALFRTLVESFRDWGRDCWCESGRDNTCGKRFAWKLGGLPEGYDHKYIYSHVGYNLKPTDIQAAIGVAQLEKLADFGARRRRNWQLLRDGFAPYEDFFELPRATAKADPSWFGFLFLVRETAPFTRLELTRRLEDRKIQTRTLFGGNLTKQPAYEGRQFRVSGSLETSDRVMTQGIFLGVYPGLDDERLRYVLDVLREFMRERART